MMTTKENSVKNESKDQIIKKLTAELAALRHEYNIYRNKVEATRKEIDEINVKAEFPSCSESFQLGVAKGLDLALEKFDENFKDAKAV